MPALWKPDLLTSRKAACSKRSRVRSGSRTLRFLSWLSNIPTSMYVKHLQVNPNDLPDSWLRRVPEFRILSPVCVWKVGETVSLVALGPSQEIVNPPLVFELWNVGSVVSRNRGEHGTPHAPSVVAQQEFAELWANSALHYSGAECMRRKSPFISTHRLYPDEKRRYDAKTVTKVLDTVGYNVCYGLR